MGHIKHTYTAVNGSAIVTATQWNATDSHNWYTWTVTISDTNDEGAVTLSPAEADTSYYPIGTITNYSSGCDFLQWRIKRTTIATGGFTVALSAPPGTGQSITISGIIAR